MKKRLFSILLALTMVLSLIPAFSITAAAETGTKISQSSFTSGLLSLSENGTYYLDENIQGNITVASGATVTLDLNGFVLKGDGVTPTEGSEFHSVITNNGTMTIIDSSTTANTHYFKVNENGMWVLDDNLNTADYTFDSVNGLRSASEGTLSDDIPAANKVIKVTGGCITGGTGTMDMVTGDPQFYGGGIYNDGTLYLQGGNIVGNTVQAEETRDGGGVFVCKNGTFTMTAGSVIGNSAYFGGGVYVSSGSIFNLAGGSVSANLSCNMDCGGGGVFNFGKLNITGGTVSVNQSEGLGGGIYNNGKINMSDGTLYANNAFCGGGIFTNEPITMTGGTISGNTAAEEGYGGAGVLCYGYEEELEFTLGGTTIISGNTAGNDASNLVLNEAVITLGTGSDAPSGMNVGVSLLNGEWVSCDGAFTTNGTAMDAQYFTSDNLAYKVKFVEGDTAKPETDPLYNNHLELTDFTITKVTSVKSSILLENNDMKSQQARKIANTLMPISGLSDPANTCIIYAADASGNYSFLKPGSTGTASDWAVQSRKLTLSEILADINNNDYYVIGTVAETDNKDSKKETSANTYAVNVLESKNGRVSVSSKKTSAGKIVTITVVPDAGYTLETLDVIDKNGNEVDLNVDKIGEKFTFTMPKGAVTVNATFMEDNTMMSFFVDVKSNDYFYEPVLWAAENSVTSGVDNMHFAPYEITDRAQMVTFLWRAAGSPEATAAICPFTDIKEDAYYYTAVLWGYENGFIKGISDTQFAPDAAVTRAQAVTFLWRYNGSIQFHNMTATGPDLSPFSDVSTNEYYYNAVLWAVAEGITEGKTETLFAPNEDCLRAQIVTFLYRSFVK